LGKEMNKDIDLSLFTKENEKFAKILAKYRISSDMSLILK